MPILTPSQFRAKNQLDAGVSNAVFEDDLELADKTLALWFGSAAYADVESGSPADPYRASVIVKVGNLLAWCYALPSLSNRIVGNGIAARVWLPDGIKIEDVPQAELEAKSASLMKRARELAKTIPVTSAFYATRNPSVLLAPMNCE